MFLFLVFKTLVPPLAATCLWATSSNHQLQFLWWKADETFYKSVFTKQLESKDIWYMNAIMNVIKHPQIWNSRSQSQCRGMEMTRCHFFPSPFGCQWCELRAQQAWHCTFDNNSTTKSYPLAAQAPPDRIYDLIIYCLVSSPDYHLYQYPSSSLTLLLWLLSGWGCSPSQYYL